MRRNDLQNLILRITPIWEDRLGISHFQVEHAFLDSYFGDDGEEDFKVTATAETRWNYMQAKIKWYMPSAIRHTKKAIEHTLVHELCHVLLACEQVLIDQKLADAAQHPITEGDFAALQNLYYERLEMATENVARSLCRAWPSAI